jgi:phosphatidylglycerol:prolipoprotein diacylglycerol transferase
VYPRLFGFLPTYGVMLALAVLTAWFLWISLLRREGLPLREATDAGFWTLIAGLLGAKVTLYLVEWRLFLEHPRRFLETIRSAGVVWGGVLIGLIVLVILARRFHLPVVRLLDSMAVPVPLAQAIGRVGCLLAGCCWGTECTRPWAITFGAAAAENTGVSAGIPLHPVQLYEAAANLIVAGLVFLVYRRRNRRPGQTVLAYLSLYAAVRIVVEVFRGDRARGLFWEELVPGGVSTGQIISGAVLLVTLTLILINALRPPPTPIPAGPPHGGDENVAAGTSTS